MNCSISGKYDKKSYKSLQEYDELFDKLVGENIARVEKEFLKQRDENKTGHSDEEVKAYALSSVRKQVSKKIGMRPIGESTRVISKKKGGHQVDTILVTAIEPIMDEKTGRMGYRLKHTRGGSRWTYIDSQRQAPANRQHNGYTISLNKDVEKYMTDTSTESYYESAQRNFEEKEQYDGKTYDPDVKQYATRTQGTLFASKADQNQGSGAGKAFEEQEVELINDPAKVKELALELDSGSDVKVTEEHKADLLGIVDTFVGHGYTKDLKLMMNKKGSVSFGQFIPYGNKNQAKGIYITPGGEKRRAKNQQGPMEKYIHELVHASVYYAIESRDPSVADTLLRLGKLHKQAIAEITVDDLMPSGSDYDVKEERKNAEALLNYIQGKDGLHEFVANGLTNENLIAKLKKITVKRGKQEKAENMWEAVKNMFSEILGILAGIVKREPISMNAHALLAKLSLDLARANNRAIAAKQEQGVIKVIGGKIDDMNRLIIAAEKGLSAKAKGAGVPKLPENPTKLQSAKYIAKSLFRYYSDPMARPHYENALTALGFTPDGIVQQLLRSVSKDDDQQRMLEELGLLSNNIDQKREDLAAVQSNNIRNGFDKKLTKFEMETLTEVMLDTDLHVLYTEKGLDKTMEIIANENMLNAEIDSTTLVLKELAKTNGDANYYINQAKGLGRYMVTGLANEIQMLNANNIARQLGTEHAVKKADKKIRAAIDKLATLEAIKRTDAPKRNNIAEMSVSEEIGITNILTMHDAFVQDSRRKLFKGEDDVNYIKGYTKEVFDQDITVEMAPVKDEKMMRENGFVMHEKLKKSYIDRNTEPMAIYINNSHATKNYNKQAFRTTDTNRKGTSLAEIYTGNGMDHIKADKRVKDIVTKMKPVTMKLIKNQRSAIVDPTETNVVPILDSNGKIKSYRYMMSKQKKKNLLNQNTKAPLVMGRMYATLLDKIESAKINKMAVKQLVADMDQYDGNGVLGDNYKEYVMIGPDNNKKRDGKHTSWKQYDELWRLLPHNTREDLEIAGRKWAKKHGKKYEGVPVRWDLIRQYFGERDFSIADTLPVQIMPQLGISAIQMAENIWKELVKIAKVDIVIRTPAVLVGNIVSNMMLSVQYGMNPSEMIKLQLKGWHELKQYRINNRKATELKMRINAEKSKPNPSGSVVKKMEAEMLRLEEEMKRSSVRALIDKGMFSSIVEEIHTADTEAGNKISRWIDDKTEGVPEIIKQGANYLYLTEKTGLYQMMLKATQESDFVARYAMYHSKIRKDTEAAEKESGETVKGKKKAEIEQKASTQTLHSFINYNKLDNKYLKYINDIGLLMFTKFFINIQKVLKNGIADHPVNFLMVMMGQMMMMDMEDITEHSIIMKNYSGMIHSPMDVIDHVTTMSLFELPTLTANALNTITKG